MDAEPNRPVVVVGAGILGCSIAVHGKRQLGVCRRQRGGGAGRAPAQRGCRHRPDHAGLAHGRAGRHLERGRPANLWGQVPEVIGMQSEAGAAGVLHGAVLKGPANCVRTLKSWSSHHEVIPGQATTDEPVG